LSVLSERRDRADDEEKSRKRRGDNTFAHNETLSSKLDLGRRTRRVGADDRNERNEKKRRTVGTRAL